MTSLTILSAGAAQTVLGQLAEKFSREQGVSLNASYGAVGAIKARVLAGEAADAVILTDELIDGLIADGMLLSGSRVDLGQVGTAVAVRADGPCPDVSTVAAFTATLLAAARIICPDPSVATAGKVFLQALGEIGILEAVRTKLEYTASGSIAMHSLMAGSAPLELAIVQATEAIACPGAVMAGPLPVPLQRMVTYSIGLAAGSREEQAVRSMIASLGDSDARGMLAAAGFQLGGMRA